MVTPAECGPEHAAGVGRWMERRARRYRRVTSSPAARASRLRAPRMPSQVQRHTWRFFYHSKSHCALCGEGVKAWKA